MQVDIEYWREVIPSYRFLKEIFIIHSREQLKEEFGKLMERKYLDPYFLNESFNFLRASIFNILSYKHLNNGKYKSMGQTSLYYSYFHSINCLLRLQKFAIVHLNYYDGKSNLTIIIERSPDKEHYLIKDGNRGNQHGLIWNQFEKYYPELMREGSGKFFRDYRSDWNYDLFYISQSTDEHTIMNTKQRYEKNFIDPNYGKYSEYDTELLADYGWEEQGAGVLIKYAIEQLSLIGIKDMYSAIRHDMDVLQSPEFTKETILSWISR